jgi:pimeloyl-ACP methyl ester carboxylesterase
MIAPLAKLLDWMAIQLVWAVRTRAVLKRQSPDPRLEEALQFLNGLDFVPAESAPARLEFVSDGGNPQFRFPTPRPCQFVENNVAYGRLYRCGESWRQQPAVILLHGAGGDPDYHYEFPRIARHCNRVGFNAATLITPFHFQRRPSRAAKWNWDYLFVVQTDYAQAISEIRALMGWFLEAGCPAVALWGNSYGGALTGMIACRDARLSAAVLSAPGLDFNVFLSAAKQVVWPRVRRELLRVEPVCDALNLTALNLTTTRPCIPKDKILLIEAVHDLFVQRESMETLWQAWGQPDIWRLPHGHASRSLLPGLTGRILRWLRPRLEKPAAKTLPNKSLQPTANAPSVSTNK